MPRGRKPEASAYHGGPFIPAQRPEPPEDLEPEEAKGEWRRIVARMPAEWFTTENMPLLGELCAHIAFAKEVRGEIKAVKQACAAEGKRWGLDVEWRAKVSGLLAEHRFQTQRIEKLSAALRLTNKARYSPEKAHDEREKVAAMAGHRPWEWHDETRQ
jgi:hypothetical protein